MNKKELILTCGIYLYSALTRKVLICHATHSPWKYWTIPKGLPEVGESAIECAGRELKEETGVDIEQVHVLKVHEFEEVIYQTGKKVLHAFLVITDSDLSKHYYSCKGLVHGSFKEIDSWKWVSPHRLSSYLHESQLHNLEILIREISKWESARKKPAATHSSGDFDPNQGTL